MVGRDHVEPFGQRIEHRGPLGEPIGAVQVDQRRARPPRRKLSLQPLMSMVWVTNAIFHLPSRFACRQKVGDAGNRLKLIFRVPLLRPDIDFTASRFPLESTQGTLGHHWRAA